MNIDLTLALIGFAFITLIVPGPNNLLLMSSGAAFGLRRTLPHLFGAILGFNALIGITTIGFGTIILDHPSLVDVLRLGGVAYLIWLGTRFVIAAIQDQSEKDDRQKRTLRPFTATEAALFQWINPSALVLAVSTVSAFAAVAETTPGRLTVFCVIFSTVALVATLTWAGFGASLSALFKAPFAGRFLRAGIGCLILLSAFYILKA